MFPALLFSGLQVSLLQDKTKGQSTAWSHGIHLNRCGQVAMLRLDAKERFFDVVVWGDQPHLIMDELQVSISTHLSNHFSGFDHDNIQPEYICPRCLQLNLGLDNESGMGDPTIFTKEQVEVGRRVSCGQAHVGELHLEEVMNGVMCMYC